MYSSLLAIATSGVYNYMYKTVKEDYLPMRQSSSLERLSRGVTIKDLPTNNWEPIEISRGAKVLAAERESKHEAQIAAIKGRCCVQNTKIASLKKKIENMEPTEQAKEQERENDKHQQSIQSQENCHESLEIEKMKKEKLNAFRKKARKIIQKRKKEEDEKESALKAAIDRSKHLEQKNSALSEEIKTLKEHLAKTNAINLGGLQQTNEVKSRQTQTEAKISSALDLKHQLLRRKDEAILERRRIMEKIVSVLEEANKKLSEMIAQKQLYEEKIHELKAENASLNEQLNAARALQQTAFHGRGTKSNEKSLLLKGKMLELEAKNAFLRKEMDAVPFLKQAALEGRGTNCKEKTLFEEAAENSPFKQQLDAARALQQTAVDDRDGKHPEQPSPLKGMMMFEVQEEKTFLEDRVEPAGALQQTVVHSRDTKYQETSLLPKGNIFEAEAENPYFEKQPHAARTLQQTVVDGINGKFRGKILLPGGETITQDDTMNDRLTIKEKEPEPKAMEKTVFQTQNQTFPYTYGGNLATSPVDHLNNTSVVINIEDNPNKAKKPQGVQGIPGYFYKQFSKWFGWSPAANLTQTL